MSYLQAGSRGQGKSGMAAEASNTMARKSTWPRKLAKVALALLILIAAGAYYFHLFIHHPPGKGPVRIAMVNPTLPPDTNGVWLIGMGDSVTAGFGASPGKSYFELLADNRSENDPATSGKCLRALFPQLMVTNLAQSGSTSLQQVKNQLPRVPADAAHRAIVVITTGGNDLIHSYGMAPPKEGAMFGATWEQAQPWIAAYGQRLEKIVQTFTNQFPAGVQIFFATIYDPSDGTGYLRHTGLRPWPEGVRILAAYNDQIRQACQKYPMAHVVEVHRAFLGHGLHAAHWWEPHYDAADPYCWQAENIEDPNDRGYDALRRLFWNVICQNAWGGQ